MYQSVKIVAGKGGWGGPLILVPTEKKNKIVSVTGGGVHPVAAGIAEMTGCQAVDGFTTGVPDEEILLAVVDCGGTARCGVYPKKGVLTANLLPVGKTGGRHRQAGHRPVARRCPHREVMRHRLWRGTGQGRVARR